MVGNDFGEQNGEAYLYFELTEIDGITADDLAVEVDIVITTINLKATATAPGYYIGWAGVADGNIDYLYAGTWMFVEVQ